MTMTFFLHDSINPNGAYDFIDPTDYQTNGAGEPAKEEFHILREKLKIPNTEGFIGRPRITAHLSNSMSQFPATLISGWAGTGKTALAASFAALHKNVSWYSVESTDFAWTVFSRYFSASLSGTICEGSFASGLSEQERDASQSEIARFLAEHFPRTDSTPTAEPSLIVLDDIHHIFDAAWFDDFFNLLLYSLPNECHLLLLCRSKPPSPLWRLRSKQMLNVMDETVIAFNIAETEALFKSLGLSTFSAKEAHRESFGRVSKLLQFASERSAILPPS